MNLNFNQLRSFVLVADEGNVTRAAHRRHTTPSAVSSHVHQLEERLGLRLFDRELRGMALTSEGQRLLPSARRSLAAARELTDTAAQLKGDRSRTLRLGLNAPPEHLDTGDVIAAAARGEPPLVIQLVSSMSERIAEDVSTGRLDAGYVYGPVTDPALTRLPLDSCTLRVVVPGGTALERLPDDARERAALPWIWPGVEGCPFRHVMATILGQHGAEANVVTWTDGEESARALVRAGMGLALLEERYAREGAHDGRLELLDPPWSIELGLVHRTDRADDPAIAALRAAIETARPPECRAAATTRAPEPDHGGKPAVEHRVPW